MTPRTLKCGRSGNISVRTVQTKGVQRQDKVTRSEPSSLWKVLSCQQCTDSHVKAPQPPSLLSNPGLQMYESSDFGCVDSFQDCKRSPPQFDLNSLIVPTIPRKLHRTKLDPHASRHQLWSLCVREALDDSNTYSELR